MRMTDWFQRRLSPPAEGPADLNIIALFRGKERWIFLYTDERRAELLSTLGRFAADPEKNFTWHDAAVLSNRVRKAVEDEP